MTKYLALDLGEKRIGVALSDTLKIIAQPHHVFPRTSRQADFAHLQKLVQEHNVSQIVVGLPINMSGEEGSMAKWVRDYATHLGETLQLPIVFWDESFTSVQAEAAMREYGWSRKKLKEKIDAVAAALILQSYLESVRPQGQIDEFF